MRDHRIKNGYKLRLRAAAKALCWWKPWFSYYAHEHGEGIAHDAGYDAGYHAGKAEGIALRSDAKTHRPPERVAEFLQLEP